MTGRLILLRAKSQETDLPEVIERIMGPQYVKFFSFISSFLMYLVAIVYFLLMCNMFHGTINFFFTKFGWPIGEKN